MATERLRRRHLCGLGVVAACGAPRPVKPRTPWPSNAPRLNYVVRWSARPRWHRWGLALFAVMALGVRGLERIPGPQVATVRFVTGLLVVLVLVARRCGVAPAPLGMAVARGVAGGLAVIAYFACIEHVGVGIATLLNDTGPVWSMLFAWLLLGGRPRRRALLALALTLAGVVLVEPGTTPEALQPGPWAAVGVARHRHRPGSDLRAVRAARPVGRDGLPGESAWSVFGCFTGLGLLATLPGMGGHWLAPSSSAWGSAVRGGPSVAAQLLMTHALAHVTAVASGIMLQLTVGAGAGRRGGPVRRIAGPGRDRRQPADRGGRGLGGRSKPPRPSRGQPGRPG